MEIGVLVYGDVLGILVESLLKWVLYLKFENVLNIVEFFFEFVDVY